jgi:hypothetical protein
MGPAVGAGVGRLATSCSSRTTERGSIPSTVVIALLAYSGPHAEAARVPYLKGCELASPYAIIRG